MSIAEKLTAIAENEQKVFDAGKKAEYDRFWDAYQSNGSRENYEYAFAGHGWYGDILTPKYTASVNAAVNMFSLCQDELNLRPLCEKFDFSRVMNFYNFAFCSNIFVVGEIDGSAAASMSNMFYECKKLHTIDKLTVNAITNLNGAFDKCAALENLTMAGTIGTAINVSACTKLTHDSLMSIINCLEAKTEGTWTVTLGTENLAKLTDAEKAIATQKGWTLA